MTTFRKGLNGRVYGGFRRRRVRRRTFPCRLGEVSIVSKRLGVTRKYIPSSDWTYESVIGSSSAVGGASMKVWRMGMENVVEA